MALAQMIKRFGHSDAERPSSRCDSGEERDAVDKLHAALAAAGYSLQ